MTARLRILPLPGGTAEEPRFALVLDRFSERMSAENFDRFRQGLRDAGTACGAVGFLFFVESVDLGQGESETEPDTVDPRAILDSNEFWEAFERQRRIRGLTYGQIP